MHRNRTDYLFLAIIGALYVGAILRYKTVPSHNLVATIIFAGIYFVWGLVHESRAHNFYLRVVLEYFLIAILGVVIISSLLL